MDFWETLFYGINENVIEYINIRNTFAPIRMNLVYQIHFSWISDALSDERMTLGPIDEEGIREMQERYAALDPSDKKIVEEEEDKLLSTLIYNFTAYMIMMEVTLLYN